MTPLARTCPSCANPLPEEAQFCPHCGSATPPGASASGRDEAGPDVELDTVRRLLAGHLRVERLIGRGGMASVYLAEDLKHRRRVAVKVMRPELAATLGADRFLREVEIAARLSHPHILPLHDSGEADGLLYYVMPFVEGESLQQRLARERILPVGDAVRIAREVAEALAYAHRHGVVHRDVKPGNILLADGHALVTDFGIARALSGDGQPLTRTGLAIGTPHYMSPEQATGSRDVDGRTDVYALGAVLYEMLVGEPPFTGPSPQAVLSRSLTEDPRPLSSTRAGVSSELQAVVATALAKDAVDRYPTASALAEALRAVVDMSSSAAHAHAARSRPRGPFAVGWPRRAIGGVVVVALVTLTAALLGPRLDGPDDTGDDTRVAVLPFVNQGDSSDAYFADGIADEVRGKLARVNGLMLIASTSTGQYRGSTRPAAEIARELGADYLLVGRVRWAGRGDARRVQVVPELVDGRTGATRWQDSYDAALTDVFEIQSRIATQVSAELGRQLGAREQRELAERPTESLPAWELYQRARAITNRDPQPQRQAVALYEQAVVLDTTFTEAWSELALALAFVYFNGSRDPAVAARSRAALEAAQRLEPDAAAVNIAAMTFQMMVESDTTAAVHAAERALRAAPRDAMVLGRTAQIDIDLSRFDEALAKLELARELDPRSEPVMTRLGQLYLARRRFDEARAAAMTSRALAPADVAVVQLLATIELARGDLRAARQAVHDAMRGGMPAPAIVARFAGVYEMAWALEPRERALLFRLTPGAFDDDRAWWAQALAIAHWQAGDTALARVFADSSLAPSAKLLAETGAQPQPQLQVLHGLMLAYLGRREEAHRLGDEALVGVKVATALERSYVMENRARIHLVLGERDRALDLIEELFGEPYHVTPGWLRLDPTFDSLRGEPRFERLAAGG